MTTTAHSPYTASTATNQEPVNVGQWFDKFVNDLRQQQQEIELNVAGGETMHIFNAIISGNQDQIALINLHHGQKHFLGMMLTQYLNLIYVLPIRQLAFSSQADTLYVWTEIADNDEQTERALLRAGSILLGNYGNYGFKLKETIVEASEKEAIPKGYIIFKKL